MSSRTKLTLLIVLTCATGLQTSCESTQKKDAAAGEQFEASMGRMLEALKTSSYAGFVAEGDDRLKSLAQKMFQTASGRFGPMLQKGYKTRFLTRLRKDDHDLLLWKLDIPGAKEDFEVRIAILHGKIDGFWLV